MCAPTGAATPRRAVERRRRRCGLLGVGYGADMLSKKKQFIATLSVLLVAGFLATSLVSYFVAHDSLTDRSPKARCP